MRSGRVELKSVVLALAVACVSAAGAVADDRYPSQPIRMVVAFPAGSGADIPARFFAEKLTALSGGTIVVENKVGANGLIAAQFVAGSKPDGYTTFFQSGNTLAANYSLFKNKPVNPAQDFQVAATIGTAPFMVMVSNNSPYKSLTDLTEAMKKKGSAASYAEANTPGKVIGELYKAKTGISATDVPYRTAADALNDLASGAVDYAVFEPGISTSEARKGTLRMLAISSGKRSSLLPDVPTMAEMGIDGLDISAWLSLIVPTGTPAPIVEKLNGWMREIVLSEAGKKYLAVIANDPMVLPPAEAQERLVRDQRDWGEYMRIAKIQPQG